MARAKTTFDVFSAIGEPKRRELLERLIVNEMTVNDLVAATSWPQPVVSKHLRVLKDVRIVSERKVGRYRFYQVKAEELRPIYKWIHQFEKYWGGTLDQLDSYLADIKSKGERDD